MCQEGRRPFFADADVENGGGLARLGAAGSSFLLSFPDNLLCEGRALGEEAAPHERSVHCFWFVHPLAGEAAHQVSVVEEAGPHLLDAELGPKRCALAGHALLAQAVTVSGEDLAKEDLPAALVLGQEGPGDGFHVAARQREQCRLEGGGGDLLEQVLLTPELPDQLQLLVVGQAGGGVLGRGDELLGRALESVAHVDLLGGGVDLIAHFAVSF